MKKIKIGIIGFGTVGQGVYKNFIKNKDLIKKRTKSEFEITKITTKNPKKNRNTPIPEKLLCIDWNDIVYDKEIDIVVELIGGTNTAYDIVREAISNKKIVVTANKALIAEHGIELFKTAIENNTQILYEAAVAGAIPIIKNIQDSFISNHIKSILAIINGTSNYILTAMSEKKVSYKNALKKAQELGYAETDPTLDVNGWDAAHKAMIIASLSYGKWLKKNEIQVIGIDKITTLDINFAEQMSYKIKHLAVIKAHKNGEIEARVVPTLIHKKNILSSVNDVYNAVLLDGDLAGKSLLYGEGAGENATASAVLADIINKKNKNFQKHNYYKKIISPEESKSHFYIRLEVDDKPGVLANVANVFAKHNIGILSAFQPETHLNQHPMLILFLHTAKYSEICKARDEITQLEYIINEPTLIHVEI